MSVHHTFSSGETEALGAAFAKKILGTKKGRIIGLQGELGSGKTTFLKGFFRGLGLRRQVISPTFILMRRTPLKRKRFKNIFHIDAYRIGRTHELARLGAKEILREPRNLVVVEWVEKVSRLLPKGATIRVKLRHGRGANERFVELP